MTVEAVAAKYGPRWEIYKGYVHWLAVKTCGQRCPDPEHGSRHILFGHDLEALVARLESADVSP